MRDSGGGVGGVALVTRVCNKFDGKLEHEAVWVLICQLVEELPP